MPTKAPDHQETLLPLLDALSRAGVKELPLRLPLAPDVAKHNPSPYYLRSLLEQADITQEAAAIALGLGKRVMRYYLSDPSLASYRPAPYLVQFALEMLAACTGQARAELPKIAKVPAKKGVKT